MGEPDKTTFAVLTAKTRGAIPKKKFLFIDSEGKPHLPVHDQAHIANAISRLGQSKTGRKWGLSESQRTSLQARARRMLDKAQHNEGPPVSAPTNLAMDVATFKLKSEPVRMTDDIVYRPARIFRAGDYPDKGFSLTPSELKAAAAKFATPINVDYEHVGGPLDGHMGQLVTVQPSEDGSTLHGILAIPRWLHGILPNAKLSATWDKASKTLVGLGLVRNPRVPDAALFAAFSADQVARGEKPIDSLLEFTDDDDDDDDDKDESPQDRFKAMIQAKKDKAKKKAKFDGNDDSQDDSESEDGSSAEASMSQAIHDVSAARGAECRGKPEDEIVRFDEDGKPRINKQAWADFATNSMQGIHDVAVTMGADCEAENTPQPQEQEGNKMGDKNKRQVEFSQFLTELDRKPGVQTPGAYAYAGSGPAVRKAQSEVDRALAERNAALEEENRQMRQQGIYDRAAAFADRAQNEMHILPVEREDVARMHMQCAHDDTFVGTASFSDGNSRVSMFETYILGRPKLNVNVEETMEALRGATAVFNRMRTAVVPGAAGMPGVDTGAPMAPERREYLLKLADSGTMTGQNLARTNGASK